MNRVCDGVVDCPDFSDELYCDYCPEKHFHCGTGRNCIPKEKMCDGHVDCLNSADEKGCGESILGAQCFSQGQSMSIYKKRLLSKMADCFFQIFLSCYNWLLQHLIANTDTINIFVSLKDVKYNKT